MLGSKLLGWRTIGYVEYEKYCQEIIKQRIADGILDIAPIFGDIKKFISDGYAQLYSDRVDVVSGGFPCQPFSVAGKRLGVDDPRNMWPSTIECIRIIRPRFAFLENVPGLLTHKYFGRILGDLAESGYDARWTVLGADDVGANHRRKRLWILASDSRCKRRNERASENIQSKIQKPIGKDAGILCEDVADTRSNGLQRAELFRKEQTNGNDIKSFSFDKSWWATLTRMG